MADATILDGPRCGARTRAGGACRAPAAGGKRRCRMHGGARGSGAPRGNGNARKHGFYDAGAVAERRRIKDAMADLERGIGALENGGLAAKAGAVKRRAWPNPGNPEDACVSLWHGSGS